MPQVRLTRKGLYEKVWSAPAAHIAKEFHISDVALGKICRKMDVPKPPRGYWERLRAGERVVPSPLPEPTGGTRLITWLHVHEEKRVDPRLQQMIDREDAPENLIIATDGLHTAHPLVEHTKSFFDNAAAGDNGLITPPKREGYLDIIASPHQSRRALIIMDALIQALEARGYTVEVSEDNWGESTRVKKEGEQITISVYETSRRFKRELTPEEKKKPPYLLNIPDQHSPSGKLNIKVNTRFGSYERFTDRKREMLEDRLNDVAVSIIANLENLLAEKHRREDAERRREEELRRREEERQRRESLNKDAKAWKDSRRLNAYLDAYEAYLGKDRERTDADGKKAEWLRWARDYAATLDPLESIFGCKTNDDEP